MACPCRRIGCPDTAQMASDMVPSPSACPLLEKCSTAALSQADQAWVQPQQLYKAYFSVPTTSGGLIKNSTYSLGYRFQFYRAGIPVFGLNCSKKALWFPTQTPPECAPQSQGALRSKCADLWDLDGDGYHQLQKLAGKTHLQTFRTF